MAEPSIRQQFEADMRLCGWQAGAFRLDSKGEYEVRRIAEGFEHFRAGWIAALEEAAKVCDARENAAEEWDRMDEAVACAGAIRALKAKEDGNG